MVLVSFQSVFLHSPINQSTQCNTNQYGDWHSSNVGITPWKLIFGIVCFTLFVKGFFALVVMFITSKVKVANADHPAEVIEGAYLQVIILYLNCFPTKICTNQTSNARQC
jgi:hypothetical protein